MTQLVWLASYPKSGNTWLRAFLHAYQTGQSLNINQLATLHSAASRTLFDDFLGLSSIDLNDAEIQAVRPRVYAAYAQSNANPPVFIKIHDTLAKQKSILPTEIKQKIIYLVRNPLDLVTSLAAHTQRSYDEIIRFMGSEFHQFQATPYQLAQRLGTWSQHVESWLAAPCEVCLVRYEDLSIAPESTFRRILQFLYSSVDEQGFQHALTESRFENLSQQEQVYGFQERSPVSERFFRKGQVGVWRSELNPAQVACIWRDHATMMHYLDYSDESS